MKETVEYLLLLLMLSLDILYLSGYIRLPRPTLELDNVSKIIRPWHSISAVTALPNSEAIICFTEKIRGVYQRYSHRVVKINRYGKLLHNIENTDTGKTCRGLQILGNMLYVIQKGSFVQRITLSQLEKDLKENPHLIPDTGDVVNFASLFHDPFKIPDKDLLLLADYKKHEVFTYRLSTKHKEVHVRGLKNLRSVSYIFDRDNTFYLVCGNHEVRVYNSTWRLVRNIGKTGSRKEKLTMPSSAIILPDGNIIIADYWEDKVSVFTVDGRFLHPLLVTHNFRPLHLTFSHPHLWVLGHKNQLRRYRLYKS